MGVCKNLPRGTVIWPTRVPGCCFGCCCCWGQRFPPGPPLVYGHDIWGVMHALLGIWSAACESWLVFGARFSARPAPQPPNCHFFFQFRTATLGRKHNNRIFDNNRSRSWFGADLRNFTLGIHVKALPFWLSRLSIWSMLVVKVNCQTDN